jgi:predicted double-glycine peptidase
MITRSLRLTLAPFRFWRSGALLFAACAAWALPANDSAAEVRFHGEAGVHNRVGVTSWRDIPFRTVVRQQYDYSCGSAALATLMRFHYGVSVGEGEIFRAMFERGDQERIRRVGFSMLDMRSFLETRGFTADGLRLSLDRLATLNAPAIALITHDNYRHFVVVKGISDTHVLVGDPTFGLQTHTREEFEAMWNGVVLAIRRAPEGAATPVFNQDDEWRPWAVAPLGDVPGPQSPSQLTRDFPEIYQLAPHAPPGPGS